MYDVLPLEYTSEKQYKVVESNWERSKQKKNALLSTLWSTYKDAIIPASFYAFIQEMLQFASPIIIRYVIKLKDSAPLDTYRILYIIGAVFISKILVILLSG